MTTSARPYPFRPPSFPPASFHSSGLSAPVSRCLLFLPLPLASLSVRSLPVPDTQLPVLPFSPPSVPPPRGFPNALTLSFVQIRSSSSLPTGFPFDTSDSAYSALLFVPFRSSLLRSHQTDPARCKQLHLQSLFSFRRLAPADDYLGSPFSASFPFVSSGSLRFF